MAVCSLRSALRADRYALVLLGLFVIAGGITVLQVAANPLAAALGTPARAHFRLTLSQAFNSLGTVFGPYLGAQLMLRGGLFSAAAAGVPTAQLREESLHNVAQAFMVIGLAVAALLLFMRYVSGRLSRAVAAPAASDDSALQALQSTWATLGAAAIFLYVGAEVSIGSMLINFLHRRIFWISTTRMPESL